MVCQLEQDFLFSHMVTFGVLFVFYSDTGGLTFPAVSLLGTHALDATVQSSSLARRVESNDAYLVTTLDD